MNLLFYLRIHLKRHEFNEDYTIISLCKKGKIEKKLYVMLQVKAYSPQQVTDSSRRIHLKGLIIISSQP